MSLPGVKLYPQGLQFTPGHGVGVGGGCVGLGVGVGVMVGVGVGVGVLVGVGVGVTACVGTWVAVGLTGSAACCDGVVGVGVDCVARLTLPTAVPIQEKNKRTARIAPHPMESFTFFVRELYHCHIPICPLGGG